MCFGTFLKLHGSRLHGMMNSRGIPGGKKRAAIMTGIYTHFIQSPIGVEQLRNRGGTPAERRDEDQTFYDFSTQADRSRAHFLMRQMWPLFAPNVMKPRPVDSRKQFDALSVRIKVSLIRAAQVCRQKAASGDSASWQLPAFAAHVREFRKAERALEETQQVAPPTGRYRRRKAYRTRYAVEPNLLRRASGTWVKNSKRAARQRRKSIKVPSTKAAAARRKTLAAGLNLPNSRKSVKATPLAPRL